MANISVAMTTYNGAKFIEEQLKSIMAQQLPVTEIVICDDVSGDNTWEILSAWQARFPEVIKIFRNAGNLGCYRNFEAALRQCSGEYIFLSDQDDFWLPEKTARLAAMLDSNPECDGVFCDSAAVDSAGKPLDFTFWQMRGFSRRAQALAAVDPLTVMLKRVPVAAHSIALRRRALEYLLPFPELPGFYPDTYLALQIAIQGKWALTPEKLTLYRVHESNVTSPQLSGMAEQLRRSRQARARSALANTANLGKVLLARMPENIPAPEQRQLQEFYAHYRIREQYAGNFLIRSCQIAREVLRGRYFRYSNGWKSIAADLLLY